MPRELHRNRDLGTNEVEYEGCEFCFRGLHTLKLLPESDERRVRAGVLELEAGDELQYELDDMPNSAGPKLHTLSVVSAGCYDDNASFRLCTGPHFKNVSFPQLKTVHLIDVCFNQIRLNVEVTPNITELKMQNVPAECSLDVILPKLEHLSVHYLTIQDKDSVDAFQAILTAATYSS